MSKFENATKTCMDHTVNIVGESNGYLFGTRTTILGSTTPMIWNKHNGWAYNYHGTNDHDLVEPSCEYARVWATFNETQQAMIIGLLAMGKKVRAVQYTRDISKTVSRGDILAPHPDTLTFNKTLVEWAWENHNQ